MTSPDTISDRFEAYRVVTDYEALVEAFNDRVDDLNTTLEQIDLEGGFTKGNAQKLLCKSSERWARTFGGESLGKMLKATGMALVMVEDTSQIGELKERLEQRKKPRKNHDAKQLSTAVLAEFKMALFRSNGAMGGQRRTIKLSKRQRSQIAKAGAMARWSKRILRKGASGVE